MNTYKKLAALALVLLLGAQGSSLNAQTKATRGTWINLTYQDVRNKYMNPAHVDDLDPAFWKQKVHELHEMGMSYLVILAIANEQKAFYPSDFMERAYPDDGRQSPVEAIMDTADELGMNVFMSCGWGVNQNDNLQIPEIKAKYLKIMDEAARLFGHHKSFFGWYLPVEDSFNPILSDHAIEAANALTERARNLTPGKKIMISPYGLFRAATEDPKFGEQIAKLKVDIIAYQDEVGCVREPMPMKRMKKHFQDLAEIHKKTNIALWANNESFTWENETNSIHSALLPAAFPRFLSQLTAVSQAGVEEVVSFAVCGIFDKPQSTMPLGQPGDSQQAYIDFMDWKAGKGRWPLLEASFANELSNGAFGKSVVYENRPDSEFNKGNLTDNKLGFEDFSDPEWIGVKSADMETVIDLGSLQEISCLAARFMNYKIKNIAVPDVVVFYVSEDGKHYEMAKAVAMEQYSNDLYDCWIDMAVAGGLKMKARYVKMVAQNKNGSWLLCDEVFVNPVKK